MCTYLKNMAGFTHSQLKNKSFDKVQKAFDKTMGWKDSFVLLGSKDFMMILELILLRIEQYFQVQDYALWDVIENGNSFKPVPQTTTNVDGSLTLVIPGLVTTEEKVQKKSDVKARSMLLMILPNEHLMTFNQYKDAQTLFAAIQTRFGGNEATKKTQMISEGKCYEILVLQAQSLLTIFLTGFRRFTQVSTANLSDDTVYAFLASQPNMSQHVYEDLKQIHEDDIEEMDLKWQLALLSMRTRRGPRNQDSRNRNQDSSRRAVNVKETSSKAMVAIDGAGFDSSYMADEEVTTNMALMAFSDSEVRESPDAPLVEELVSDDKLEKKIIFPTIAKMEFVRPKQQENPVRKPVKYAEMYSFDHVQVDCNYHQRERVVSGNNYTRVNYNYSAKNTHPSAHRNMVLKAVLMKTGLRSLTNAHPKTTAYRARPMSCFSKLAQSTVKRPYQSRTSLTNKNFNQKINTAKEKVYTAKPKKVNIAKPKVINTARPTSAVVNAVRANQVHPQKEDQGYVDSRCSRHMTGNMSYLTYFKEFDGEYVTFGGGARGGRITSKGTLKTGKLDFEDVYFVKELNVARTPQQSGVAKRRNKTLIEAFRTMLADSKLPTTFWVEAVNTAFYV
ncbi:ribonuclease H-like domain-containing protein [Tanacetum coccineum]